MLDLSQRVFIDNVGGWGAGDSNDVLYAACLFIVSDDGLCGIPECLQSLLDRVQVIVDATGRGAAFQEPVNEGLFRAFKKQDGG